MHKIKTVKNFCQKKYEELLLCKSFSHFFGKKKKKKKKRKRRKKKRKEKGSIFVYNTFIILLSY